MRFTRRRVLAGAGITAAAGAVGMVALSASPDPQALLVGFIAGERRYNHLPTLVGNPGLQAQAELQAARMAGTHTLFHTPVGELNWWVNPHRQHHLTWVGEIVGYGGATETGLLDINRAWIRSPGHQAIMLHPNARLLGVGVREGGGLAWVSAVLGY